MNVAVVTTISEGTPWAKDTIPNTIKYCDRHGYSFFIINAPYSEVLNSSKTIALLLDVFKYVWAIDSDVVITNHSIKVESLEIADGINVCLENLWDGNKLNCGSSIYHGEGGKRILKMISDEKPAWEKMMFYWQQWLNEKTSNNQEVQSLCKIHPSRTFNSCHYQEKNNWQEGDFVYHPCGAWVGARIDMCKAAINKVK